MANSKVMVKSRYRNEKGFIDCDILVDLGGMVIHCGRRSLLILRIAVVWPFSLREKVAEDRMRGPTYAFIQLSLSS
jgi:hypothetical protein